MVIRVCVCVCVRDQLLEAGLRELNEETGLKLDPEDVSPKLLGLWEVRHTHTDTQADTQADRQTDRQVDRIINMPGNSNEKPPVYKYRRHHFISISLCK